KDALLKVGGYDEKLKIGEDYELWLRLGKSWRFTNLPDYLIKYRIHQQGVMASGMLRAVKNAKMLIQKYKADYPNYYFGLLIANLRMIWYALMPFR
ncbi:hypothetical protein HY389_01010, partial [Candidatus Daviesbacteria bacterium]|nr:hypothetical protein [Candidatus Daviesbacteria bacterium]